MIVLKNIREREKERKKKTKGKKEIKKYVELTFQCETRRKIVRFLRHDSWEHPENNVPGGLDSLARGR